MELSLTLVMQILGMVLMVLMGFLGAKGGLLCQQDSYSLSRFTVYIITPCTLINAFQTDLELEKLRGLALALVASGIIHGLFLLVSALMCLGKHGLRPEEQVSILYTNCGNLIIPMVWAVLGEEYVFYTSAYLLVQNVLIWTHGQAKLGGNGGKTTLRTIFVNPGMLGIGAGFLLFFLQIRLTGPLHTAVSGLAQCIGPLSMVIVGILMAGTDWRKTFLSARIYGVAALRLLVLPVMAVGVLWLLLWAWPMEGGSAILLVVALASAAPSASVVIQLSQLNRHPGVDNASAINVVTTALCAVTMPMIVLLYQALYQS